VRANLLTRDFGRGIRKIDRLAERDYRNARSTSFAWHPNTCIGAVCFALRRDPIARLSHPFGEASVDQALPRPRVKIALAILFEVKERLPHVWRPATVHFSSVSQSKSGPTMDPLTKQS
jgi:hypothetical protein